MITEDCINVCVDAVSVFLCGCFALSCFFNRKRNVHSNNVFLFCLLCSVLRALFDMLEVLFVYINVPVWLKTLNIDLIVSFGYLGMALFGHYLYALVPQCKRVYYHILITFDIVCDCLCVLTVILAHFKLVYGYDAAGVYYRGPLFFINVGAPMAGMLFLLVIVLLQKIPKLQKVIFAGYCVVPVIGLVCTVFNENISWVSMINLAMIVIIYTWIYTESVVKVREKEAEISQNRIDLLTSQINPHFLYNTLATIKHLVKTGDKETAADTIDTFSGYLRSNLNFVSGEKMTMFYTELDGVKGYLEIEKLRFGERLNVIFNIKSSDFRIPAFILQPIVENAVRHGVTKKSEGGCITLSSSEDDKFYYITVADDGVGFDTSLPFDESRPHIGIKNIRDRIDLLCNGEMTVQSRIGEGTTVKIILPKRSLK